MRVEKKIHGSFIWMLFNGLGISYKEWKDVQFHWCYVKI